MSFTCKNLKCPYYGTERCFAKRCPEPCKNTQCQRFGQDHFAEGCLLKCDFYDCVKYGQYHSPGECWFRQANGEYCQQYASSPPPEAQQARLNFYQQTLSTIGQNFPAPFMMANQLLSSHLPQSGTPSSPFLPTMGNNNMFNPQNQNGWPNGQF